MEVTERDLRDPKYRDGEPSDYEFREDGQIARKDRWEVAVREIAALLGWSHKPWEIEEVINAVRHELVKNA